jgi:BON domain
MTIKAPTVRITGRRARARIWRSKTPRTARRSALAPAAMGVGCVALGALLEYFLDSSAGRRRRHRVRDQAVSRLRRSERRAVRRARSAESHAIGVVRRTVNAGRRPKAPVDDATLADRVESEVFRRAHVSKARINVNVEDGIVFLRGVAEREDEIERIGAAAERIPGVRGVENLLHTPDTPPSASRPRLVRDRAVP